MPKAVIGKKYRLRKNIWEGDNDVRLFSSNGQYITTYGPNYESRKFSENRKEVILVEKYSYGINACIKDFYNFRSVDGLVSFPAHISWMEYEEQLEFDF